MRPFGICTSNKAYLQTEFLCKDSLVPEDNGQSGSEVVLAEPALFRGVVKDYIDLKQNIFNDSDRV